MNIPDLTQSAMILATYSVVPMNEPNQTIIKYNYSQHIEKISLLSLFEENKAKLKLDDVIEPIALEMYKNALEIIFHLEEQHRIGVEFTNSNTIFITSLLDELDTEIHIELYFNKEERNTFFSIYNGDDMIDTGFHPLNTVSSKVNKLIEENSNKKQLIPA